MTNQIKKSLIMGNLEIMIDRESGVRSLILDRAEKLLESGAIDLDKYPEDNFKLPRILLNAGLLHALDQYELLRPEEKKELKNLRKF